MHVRSGDLPPLADAGQAAPAAAGHRRHRSTARPRTGRFFVQDIYQGLTGVERGEVKWLRVIEETSRVSATHRWAATRTTRRFWSAAALGLQREELPGHRAGRARTARPTSRCPPAGPSIFRRWTPTGGWSRACGRSCRPLPGTTRSCIGCHEHKYTRHRPAGDLPGASAAQPSRLRARIVGQRLPRLSRAWSSRSWTGTASAATAARRGSPAGMDLSGGWTEHFNISYENLANRRETQLIAYWIAGHRLHERHGALVGADLPAPRPRLGRGAAGRLLVDGHDGQIPDLTRTERDLLMAWIDTNGLYHGTWNRTASGCRDRRRGTRSKKRLTAEMQAAGCLDCHGRTAKLPYFENDWVNLEHPERSRILRAPLAAEGDGHGAGLVPRRKVTPTGSGSISWNGYAHAVQPAEAFPRTTRSYRPTAAASRYAVPLTTDDPHYQAMLAIIRDASQACWPRRASTCPGRKSCRAGVGTCCPPCRLPCPRSWKYTFRKMGRWHWSGHGNRRGLDWNSRSIAARPRTSCPRGQRCCPVPRCSPMSIGPPRPVRTFIKYDLFSREAGAARGGTAVVPPPFLHRRLAS